jgi:hypothetical protein
MNLHGLSQPYAMFSPPLLHHIVCAKLSLISFLLRFKLELQIMGSFFGQGRTAPFTVAI